MPLVNYSVADRDLKYYIFDWDDNILHMPTRIHLERKTESGEWIPHAVSTAVFSVIRDDRKNYRPPDGDWEKAFVEFRDLDAESESVFPTGGTVSDYFNLDVIFLPRRSPQRPPPSQSELCNCRTSLRRILVTSQGEE